MQDDEALRRERAEIRAAVAELLRDVRELEAKVYPEYDQVLEEQRRLQRRGQARRSAHPKSFLV